MFGNIPGKTIFEISIYSFIIDIFIAQSIQFSYKSSFVKDYGGALYHLTTYVLVENLQPFGGQSGRKNHKVAVRAQRKRRP